MGGNEGTVHWATVNCALGDGKAVVVREAPLGSAVGAGVVGEPPLGPLVLSSRQLPTIAKK